MVLISCNQEQTSFENGLFASYVDGSISSIIYRKGSIQIEQNLDDNSIDTFKLEWINEKLYSLESITKKDSLDNFLLFVKIDSIKKKKIFYSSTMKEYGITHNGIMEKIGDIPKTEF